MAIHFKEIIERDKKETLDYHNFEEWHKLGYEGQGYNYLEIEDETMHGKMVRDAFKLVAPKSNAYLGNMSYRVKGDKVIFCDIRYYDSYIPIKQFVEELNIHTIGASLSGARLPEALIDYLQTLPVAFIGSAGNDGDRGITGKFRHLGIMSGAIYLDNGKVRKESYSAIGELMDFATLHSWAEGTSFSQPVLSGMRHVIMSKYGYLTQEETYKAFLDIAIDVGVRGHDTYFGHGVPILPENGVIDILEEEEVEIKMDDFLQVKNIYGIPLIIDPILDFDNRKSYPMDAEYITIHNFGGSASAGAVTKYIDDTDEVKSWHFTVGKDVIYQEMPINLNAWHAGDYVDENNMGTGNMKSIGIEIEENKEAMMNAVKLVAFLKQEKDYEIKTHQDWSGKYCPGWILKNYSKQYFVDAVDAFLGIIDHWAEKHFQNLNDKGIVIHERRFEDKIDRDEIFALLDRVTDDYLEKIANLQKQIEALR